VSDLENLMLVWNVGAAGSSVRIVEHPDSSGQAAKFDRAALACDQGWRGASEAERIERIWSVIGQMVVRDGVPVADVMAALEEVEDFPASPQRRAAFELVPVDLDYVSPKYAHLHRWGDWLLDTDRLVLCLCQKDDNPLNNRYEVDIEGISSPEDVLFWICHVGMKNWATATVAGHFSKALSDIFRPRDRERGVPWPSNSDLLKGSIEREW